MRNLALALLLTTALSCTSQAQSTAEVPEGRDGAMTRERMEEILRSLGSDAEGPAGTLDFSFAGVPMVCISDTRYDRMRIIAPVISVSDLSAEHVVSIFEANFHTALDARYASSQGVLYAAFIHPLSSLTERQLLSAVRQVANLARSFGTTYDSGELVYGGGGQPL